MKYSECKITGEFFVNESDSISRANDNAKRWFEKAVERKKEIERLITENRELKNQNMCVWEDCDQEASYCEGHAHELVNPLGREFAPPALEVNEDGVMTDKSQDADWLRARFFERSAEVEILENSLETQTAEVSHLHTALRFLNEQVGVEEGVSAAHYVRGGTVSTSPARKDPEMAKFVLNIIDPATDSGSPTPTVEASLTQLVELVAQADTAQALRGSANHRFRLLSEGAELAALRHGIFNYWSGDTCDDSKQQKPEGWNEEASVNWDSADSAQKSQRDMKWYDMGTPRDDNDTDESGHDHG